MDRDEVLTLVRRFADRVSGHFRLRRVIIFGSAARDAMTRESDIDVAVLADEPEGDFLKREALLFRLRREIDERISPLLFESEHDRGGFFSQILKDGVVVL